MAGAETGVWDLLWTAGLAAVGLFAFLVSLVKLNALRFKAPTHSRGVIGWLMVFFKAATAKKRFHTLGT